MDGVVAKETNLRDGNKGGSVRTTITISSDALDKLDWLAKHQGISRNDAIRRAIATEAYIREELDKESTILVRKQDKSIHELVFIR